MTLSFLTSHPQFLFPDAKADKVDVDKVDTGVDGVPDDMSSSKSDSSQLNEQSKVNLVIYFLTSLNSHEAVAARI